MQIRWLTLDDAAAWYALRLEMLEALPGVFSADPDAARKEGVAHAVTRLTSSRIAGAFRDDALVGAVGLWRRDHPKMNHRTAVWGMYVCPHMRRAGCGEALMRFVIAAARTTPDTAALELSVTSDAPGARRLYERLGFVCWGVEAAAMRIDGRLIDEAHYVLRFDASDPD